ncbi:MAG: hypothetical protein Q9193_002057 [Seirophora villosa]
MEAGGPPPYGNDNKGAAIIIGGCITVALATLFVVLRFIVRIWVVKAVWWDDWTILFAALGNIIGLALDLVEVHYGFGRPQYYLSEHQLILYSKYAYGEWIQTFATLMWTKVSICLFLMRIPATKALIRPLQGAVIFLVVTNIILTILWIAQCRPVAAAWDTTLEPSLCFSRGELLRIIIAQANGGIPNWFWRTLEIQIGIMAACAPALRPGYRRLVKKIKAKRASRGQTKIPDEVRLRSVERKLPESFEQRRSSRTFGNTISVGTSWDPPTSATDYIKKTTDFEIEQRHVLTPFGIG